MLSSATNFATGVIVARFLGPAEFGAYAVGYGSWAVVMSLTRALVVYPYSSRVAAATKEERTIATESAAALSAGIGLLCGVVVFLIGSVIGCEAPIGRSLVAVSLFLPFVALQDFWRFAAFSLKSPKMAFCNDLMWACVQVQATLLVWSFDVVSSPTMIAAWGSGGVAAAAFGIWQFGARPRLSHHAMKWAKETARAGGWFALASIIYGAGAQMINALIVVAAGRAALGGMQSVNNLFAPSQLLTSAIQAVGLAPAAEASARQHQSNVRRIAVLYTIALGVATSIYAGAILSTDTYLLSMIFGPEYVSFSVLLLPIALGLVVNSWSSGAVLVLIASGSGRSLARIQAVVTVTQALAVTTLAGTYGVQGAAWGMFIGVVVSFVGLWWSCFNGPARTRRAIKMTPHIVTDR